MAETDDVMVQPLTSYMEGAEHKNAQSKPYKMPRWQAAELEALGHAKIVKGEAKASADEPRAATAGETAPDGDAPARGRRGTLKV